MDPVPSNQPVLRFYHVGTWCYFAQDFAVTPLFTMVMIIWPGVHILSMRKKGYVSASSFVIVSFGFSSPTQMLVTDYVYGWHNDSDIGKLDFVRRQRNLCARE